MSKVPLMKWITSEWLKIVWISYPRLIKTFVDSDRDTNLSNYSKIKGFERPKKLNAIA